MMPVTRNPITMFFEPGMIRTQVFPIFLTTVTAKWILSWYRKVAEGTETRI